MTRWTRNKPSFVIKPPLHLQHFYMSTVQIPNRVTELGTLSVPIPATHTLYLPHTTDFENLITWGGPQDPPRNWLQTLPGQSLQQMHPTLQYMPYKHQLLSRYSDCRERKRSLNWGVVWTLLHYTESGPTVQNDRCLDSNVKAPTTPLKYHAHKG